MYNLSNLEPKFKNFLLAENISAVTLRNYLSDFRHFIGWYISQPHYSQKLDLRGNITNLNAKVVLDYKNHHIKSSLPLKTTNRRLSALRKFFLYCQKEGLLTNNPAKEVTNLKPPGKIINPPSLTFQTDSKQTNAIGVNNNPFRQELDLNIQNAPVNYKLFSLFLIPLMIGLAVFLNSLLGNRKEIKHYPLIASTPQPKRYLGFSGKLLDSLGNPITTKTDVTFKLYNSATDNLPLYTSSCLGESGAITPDVSGNIKVLLGSDCDHKPIPAGIFTENPNLYLGISIGTDVEMQPRQNIPNVGYARNSDTLQGFSVGNKNLSVPYINEDGNLLIASENTGIRSTYESSNFSLSSAETITLESAQAGDVVLQATESGTIKLRTGGFSDSYTRLIINNEGNIGIGTLFPTYGFEVNDDIKITSGNRLILASASTDPSGENGAMYYNTQSNKFRCFQNGSWLDCFSSRENNAVGGIYAGNLTEGSKLSELESRIDSLNSQLQNLQNQIVSLNNSTSEKISNLLTTNYLLLTSQQSDRDKIASPVIEPTRIKNNKENLTIDLSNTNQDNPITTHNPQPNTNKGPLASLIIKGLENKTVATIDAEGNASFSAALTADSLQINTDATIAGTLKAKEIQAENINTIENNIASLSGNLSQLNENNSVSTEQWNNDLNNIQKLLADIKNQPLSDPTYYQNIENNETVKQMNDLALEQLTVTGKSNFYNLSVTDSGTIGNLLIHDNSILSLAWDLKLSALANIKFFDDAVVISNDGNIRTTGRVIANAGIVTNKIEALNENDNVMINNLAFQNVTIDNKYLLSASSSGLIASADNFSQNGISSPAIDTQTATAGNGIIPQNSQEVIIYNSKVKQDSLIYLTSTSPSLNSNLTVSNKETCKNESNETMKQLDNEVDCKPYFKVTIDQPAVSPVSFNWLIID